MAQARSALPSRPICDPAGAFPPSVIAFSAAISACEKGQQWEKALVLLKQMTQKELSPGQFHGANP